MSNQTAQPLGVENQPLSDPILAEMEVPISEIPNPVLSRLLEEVRNSQCIEARYDRVHNRHNRGR